MSRARTIAVLLVAASTASCGSSRSDRDEHARRDVASTTEPAGPRPSPGIDLQGPIPIPDLSGGGTRGTARTTDLMTDRAIVEVRVPSVPSGGAVQFTLAGDHRAWVTSIPDSVQLPAAAFGHDRIYISGGFESVSFYALDATTGKVEWATTNLEDNGPTAAVIEDEDVLFNTESCTLFALDAKSGKRKWFRFLGDPTLAQIAVVDGMVYSAHPAEDGTHHLSAFKVKTGELVWSRSVSDELLATPVIAGDSVYVSTLAGDTYRFDHRTGKQLWRKPLRATTAPWVAGDELYVARRVKGKEQQVVVSTKDGSILREHAVSPGAYVGDVPADLGNWKSVWAFEGSRPVVERGIRYVAMGNEIAATDAASGTALWARRYPGDADRRALGSVAIAGSAVVVSSRDGKVFGLDVDTGFTLWSYDLGHRISAEPIIAKGWLYVTTVDGLVIALEVADPSLDGWHMFGGNAQKNGPTLAPPVTPPPEGIPTRAAAG